MSNKNQKAPLAPGLSRRGFLTLGGMAALGAGAALAGCAPQTQASGAAGGSDAGAAEGAAAKALAPNGQEYPWAAEPPAIADDLVEEEIDCDVCVIGLGVSGVAAFRAAAEAGAKTVGFEKGATPQCRSSQYAYVNGSLSERLGLKADFDLEKVFEHEFNDCSQITNQSIVRKWLYHHTEAVDWWIEGGDCYVPGPGEVMGGNPMMGEPDPNHPVNVTSMSDPSIDYENENQAAYPENLSFSDHQAILDNNVAKAEAAGAVAYYGHFGEQVVKDGSGRVVGAYVRNAETGKYKKVNAAKGVVCSMGDGASNPDIMNFFYPHVVENGNFNPWPNMDVEGNLTNTGDVYPLGYWANAGFSQYQAPMIHVMGGPGDNGDQSVSMGFTGPLLRLNYNGKRFQNEDVAATECEFAFEKQPQKKAFMVFDAHFDEQAPQCINTFSSSLQEMDARVGDGVIFKGATLKELFESIEGMDAEEAVKSVERYNELCAAGVDEDFGKKAKYLWPVQDGPFYAQRMGMGLCLCTMGGLSSDEEAHVLDTDHEVIPGLYVSGNAQGDRFAVKYPFKLSGTSHCMAMYYGKVAGENAAAGK